MAIGAATRGSPGAVIVTDGACDAGSGGNSSVDLANMMKPALAKGTLKVIASTTWEEYTKDFEKDRALMRRFQRVVIDEPDEATAVKIIKGLKKYYEKHHGVKITNQAVIDSVKYSIKYLSDKKLPDKAIDLIDTAAAKLKDDFADIKIRNDANIFIFASSQK